MQERTDWDGHYCKTQCCFIIIIFLRKNCPEDFIMGCISQLHLPVV